MQSVLLSVLLTFARQPWYAAYTRTTAAWGLEPLADQQLAGVIMWIPAGGIYLAVALALFVAWVRASETGDRLDLRRRASTGRADDARTW
jgi:putative membrane protein